MQKVKPNSQDILVALQASIAMLQTGKKVNIPKLEQSITACERAMKKGLQICSQLKVEVRKLKKEQASKAKAKKAKARKS